MVTNHLGQSFSTGDRVKGTSEGKPFFGRIKKIQTGDSSYGGDHHLTIIEEKTGAKFHRASAEVKVVK